MKQCLLCAEMYEDGSEVVCPECRKVEAEIEKYRTERSGRRSKSQLTNHQHKPKEKKYANGNIRKQ